jgi:hypothetical protein
MSARPFDPYVDHDIHLRRVHAALDERLRGLSDPQISMSELVEKTRWLARAFLWHHHAESTILFPRLRVEGRMRSVDVAFLDACDRDHRTLEKYFSLLLDAAKSPHVARSQILSLAADLAPLLARHVAEEEAGLAVERLRSMIGPDGLLAIGSEPGRVPRSALNASLTAVSLQHWSSPETL